MEKTLYVCDVLLIIVACALAVSAIYLGWQGEYAQAAYCMASAAFFRTK